MINKVKVLLLVASLLLSMSIISANSNGENSGEKITLKYVTWDNVTLEYMLETNPMSELYQQTHPNVTIEIERTQDSESFEQIMQIRAAAGELPDILSIKPYMLEKYKDLLLPLDGHPSVDANKFADMYRVDGKILGIPAASFNEFVYYRKSIFRELGLTIPQTWDEYLNILETIKEDGRYIPLAMGLKDAWPDYPFNEYMPLLESGDGNYYNEMASIEQPFTKGKPFYNSYKKIQDMYDLNVMGEDPLGMGWDQVRAQFAAGEAAMIAAGQWFIADYENNMKGDIDDLGIFFLPVRDTKSDTQYATVMADTFYTVPSTSKYAEEAQEFIRWYFDVYYPQILPVLGVSSTVEGVEVTGNPVLGQVSELEQPEFILVTADGADYTRIKNEIQFDVKAMGQEMYADVYESFDSMMDTFNNKWSTAQPK